jgi:hypothetical protein
MVAPLFDRNVQKSLGVLYAPQSVSTNVVQ